MLLVDRNGIEYRVLFSHPSGDLYVRYVKDDLNVTQEKWVKANNQFYRVKKWKGDSNE